MQTTEGLSGGLEPLVNNVGLHDASRNVFDTANDQLNHVRCGAIASGVVVTEILEKIPAGVKVGFGSQAEGPAA